MTRAKKTRCEDIICSLTDLGVQSGSLLMVHSSLSSIGNVQGGAETVVDALLKVLGPKGTLVVPTFTYPGDYPPSRDPNWIFDPDRTPSAMGAITNAARTRPQAQRSFHLWHSVAAIGPLANTITTIGGSSAWNSNSPMAWICKNGGQFLLLGVPYGNLTAIHIWEVALAVAYRREYDVKRRMRCSDGSLAPLISRVHDRTESHPGSDFNRFGEHLEAANKVQIGPVGNAIGRLFAGIDAARIAKVMYIEDQHAFLKQGDTVTALSHGKTIKNAKGFQSVVDPDLVFPATSPAQARKV